jgi:hypothetical protein
MPNLLLLHLSAMLTVSCPIIDASSRNIVFPRTSWIYPLAPMLIGHAQPMLAWICLRLQSTFKLIARLCRNRMHTQTATKPAGIPLARSVLMRRMLMPASCKTHHKTQLRRAFWTVMLQVDFDDVGGTGSASQAMATR